MMFGVQKSVRPAVCMPGPVTDGLLLQAVHWTFRKKCSTMVGETFEIYLTKMAIIHLKSSTMFGQIFKIYLFKMAIMHLKCSTMVGENFAIYISEMAKIAMKRIIMQKILFGDIDENNGHFKINMGHYGNYGNYGKYGRGSRAQPLNILKFHAFT